MPQRVHAQSASSAGRLYDKYLFCDDQQVLNTIGGAIVRGKSGSVVECAPDALNLIDGTFTIASGTKPISVSAGELKLTLPVNSKISMRLSADCALTVHQVKAPIAISGTKDGQEIKGAISQTGTVPPGAASVSAVDYDNLPTTGRPMFFVGNAEFEQRASGLALKGGQLFVCPGRDTQILTPYGIIKAKAHSRFFINLADSAGTIRLLNCASKALVFASGNKFRRVGPFEEFCFYDHRPSQEEVLPVDGLGRKEIVLHQVEGESTASTNSFLLTSMLASPYFLGDWQRYSSLDKRLLQAMLKSQAALESAMPSAEQFFIAPDTYKEMR